VEYKDLNFKIPQETPDYTECSEFVVKQIEEILRRAIEAGTNKIMVIIYLTPEARFAKIRA